MKFKDIARWKIALSFFISFLIYGIFLKEPSVIYNNAERICLSCIGIK
ncbi:MAG: hypothetical protein MOIL_01031 [Candidatus Methanolliviera sp. GoM_oil]|nr:MAG: hypothetical protein MOIL_01031 [Candidatus Methanolliviera sp. GoM_oil]